MHSTISQNLGTFISLSNQTRCHSWYAQRFYARSETSSFKVDPLSMRCKTGYGKTLEGWFMSAVDSKPATDGRN
jgi:hypothetical protein